MKKIKFGYYGNFTRSWSTEVYIADALERAGYIIERRDKNDTTLIDCDYLLCAKLIKIDILLKAKKKGIPTISWSFDLCRGKRYRFRASLPHFKADIVITTDPDDIFHTLRLGVKKEEKKMIIGKKIYDLIFVGNPYYQERRNMIKRSKAKLIRNIRGLALNKLLGQTKIVLGDTYPASGCWSDRIYEITGRGGFIIHPKVRDLQDYIPQFERGNYKEMIKMINYYLENENEREELRKIQFEKCPTIDDRIPNLIKIIKSYE